MNGDGFYITVIALILMITAILFLSLIYMYTHYPITNPVWIFNESEVLFL